MRVAPGGAATICLGLADDDEQCANAGSSNSFANGTSQNTGNVITDRPSTRLHCAPGGATTICLGLADDDDSFANTKSSNSFANGSSQNTGNVITDRSSTRLHCAPGGPTTISLAYDETPSKSTVEATAESSQDICAAGVDTGTRNGHATLCLGVDDAHQQVEDSGRVAPGGHTTICLMQDPLVEATPSKLQPPGGNASICLGVDDDSVVVDVPASGRKPPGGESTVSFAGEQSSSTAPDLVVRQTPGGNSSICFGMSDNQGNESSNSYANGANQNCGNFITNRSSTRLTHGPGGPTTICLGMEEEEKPPEKLAPTGRVAPGGETTICFGLASESEPVDVNHMPRPVGGAATICLGVANDEDSEEGSDAAKAQTDRVAPGGASTICLGSAPDELILIEQNETRQAPGGNATICLGVLDEGDENVNTGNYLPQLDQDKPAKILGERICPGGNSTLILG